PQHEERAGNVATGGADDHEDRARGKRSPRRRRALREIHADLVGGFGERIRRGEDEGDGGGGEQGETKLFHGASPSVWEAHLARPIRPCLFGGARPAKESVKQADKRDSVTALAGYDDHSSRPRVAARLEPPTRRLGGPRHRM